MVRPRAKGSLMRSTLSPHRPKSEPSVPVATTNAAVSEGMPPYMAATSTAKGMDTPLGMMEITTSSGIEIKELYTSTDAEGITDPSLPGTFPYTRGVQASMYRGKLWTMRQYAGFSTAEESNKRYHYLLSQGVSGLSVAFDLPTQIGYNCNHPLANGEVGKVGVSINSIEDMERLF